MTLSESQSQQSPILDKLDAAEQVCTIPITKKDWMELVFHMKSSVYVNSFGQVDRRRQNRYTLSQETIVGIEVRGSKEKPRGEFLLARCRDISSRGLGVFHPEPFAEDTACFVQLFTKSHDIVLRTGSIRYCQPYENGTYRLGIHLTKHLNLLDFL